MSIPRFPEKDPAESVVLSFDFTGELLDAEQLNGTPTITVHAAVSQEGATLDPTPANILNGPAGFDAAKKLVLQPVFAGFALNDYEVKVVTTTTNASKVLAFAGTLPVRTI